MVHKHTSLILVSSIVLLLAAQLVGAQSFTLEQVMSSPFPSELTVSKRGDRVAWAFDAEGKRNIWIAEAINALRQRRRPGADRSGFRA
jgi:hypothetical protein